MGLNLTKLFFPDLVNTLLPADAIQLSPEEEKLFVAALQGQWDLEVIDTSLHRLPNYRPGRAYIVTNISYTKARVHGKSYTMTGGNSDDSGPAAMTCTFSFTRAASTGLVYIDRLGSSIVTPSWPQTRPLADKKGEIVDLRTISADIRWTRSVDYDPESKQVVGFGQMQHS